MSAAGKPDQRSVHRQPRHKRLGAVDGIEHPDVLGVFPVLAELLSDHAVSRIACRDHLAQPHFHRAVDLGDRRCVRLAMRDASRAGCGTHDLARRIGQAMCELDEVASNRFSHRSAYGFPLFLHDGFTDKGLSRGTRGSPPGPRSGGAKRVVRPAAWVDPR